MQRFVGLRGRLTRSQSQQSLDTRPIIFPDCHALLRGVTSLHYPAEIPCDKRLQRWLLGDALIQLERSIPWWMMNFESPLTRASSRPWDASTLTLPSFS